MLPFLPCLLLFLFGPNPLFPQEIRPEMAKLAPPIKAVGTSGSRHRMSKEELESLLDQTEKKFGKIQSLWTDFVQEKHLAIFTEVVKAKGRCIFQSPGMVRFEITEPFQSVLIVKGNAVTKYEFLEGKWQKLHTGGQQLILMVIEHITSWIQGRFREKNDIYEIAAEKNNTEGQTKIILSPRDEGFRKHLQSIELIMTRDESGLEQIILLEPGEDYTLIRFMNERRNLKISPEVFDTRGTEPLPADF